MNVTTLNAAHQAVFDTVLRLGAEGKVTPEAQAEILEAAVAASQIALEFICTYPLSMATKLADRN